MEAFLDEIYGPITDYFENDYYLAAATLLEVSCKIFTISGNDPSSTFDRNMESSTPDEYAPWLRRGCEALYTCDLNCYESVN